MIDPEDHPMFIEVHREGWGEWHWLIHDWSIGRPWWDKGLRRGSAMTERGAFKAARRAAADERRSRDVKEATA